MPISLTSGILAAAKPTANSFQDLWTCPSGKSGTFSIYVSNLGSNSCEIFIRAVKSGDTPGDQHVILHTVMPGVSSWNLTGIALGSGDKIQVMSNTGNTSFVLMGVLTS